MAEHLSVFDILKIGVGPSSSHTLGPWKAALRLQEDLEKMDISVDDILSVRVLLYGSLAKTGIGHGTDIAVILGLMGEGPETFDVEQIQPSVEKVKTRQKINLYGSREIDFDYHSDIVLLREECLSYHPNGMSFLLQTKSGENISKTYFSIGGGFVVTEAENNQNQQSLEDPEFPIDTADDLLHYCQRTGMNIAQIAYENELTWLEEGEVNKRLRAIKEVMEECIYRGAHTRGILPGGLQVQRRSPEINARILKDMYGKYEDLESWIVRIRAQKLDKLACLDWLNVAALAVNEENASFSRVVTAPTNGAAGVIPAVLFYLRVFEDIDEEKQMDFLLAAAVIGMIFKKGATISAAMGGCQAEIGVSSAMAAAAYSEVMGGTVKQSLEAAEIAMEHHLGLTCDPVGGLVQIPCIERNCMGAIKAITAGQIALNSNPFNAKVSLDSVVRTMLETAMDMNTKYKETSDGGLATQFPEGLIEC